MTDERQFHPSSRMPPDPFVEPQVTLEVRHSYLEVLIVVTQIAILAVLVATLISK